MVPFLFIVAGIVIFIILSRLSEQGAKLGALTREMQFLQRRMHEIEQELLRHRPQDISGSEEATTPRAETPHAPPPAPVIADLIRPAETIPAAPPPVMPPAPPVLPEPDLLPPPQPMPARSPAPTPATPSRPPVPVPAAPTPPREALPSTPRWMLPTTREGWEELIGGNLFNWIGAIAVVIGLALALLYAIQKGFITPPLRIALGYAVGIGLLLLGYRFHRRGMATFAQGLIGAGIAVCYLCGYASYVPAVVGAFGAEPMVSYPVAFVLMIAAAILAFQQAILYDSLAVALLGWVGGFLTPFILRSGNENVLGLLTYLAFLTLGMVALVIWRDRWAVLEPLTLVTTYLLYFTLSLLMPGTFASIANAPLAAGFLIIIWAMFHAADLHRAYWRVTSQSQMRQFFSALNPVMMWGLLYLTLTPHYHDSIAAVSLGMGVVYFAGALLFERWGRKENQLVPRSTVCAIVLLALATWIELHGFTRITAWSVEAAVILWAGLRWRRDYAWISALSLLGVAFVVLLFVPNTFYWQHLATFTPVLNPRVLAFLVLAAGLLYAAIRFRDRDELRAVLHYGWISLVFALLAVEVNDGFRALYQSAAEGTAWVDASRVLSIALSWTLCSLPLLGIGLSTRIKPLIVSGLLAGMAGALLALVEGVRLSALTAHPLSSLVMRGIFFVLIIAALFFHASWARREEEHLPWLRGIHGFMHVLIAVIGFELVSLEILDAFSLLAQHGHAGLLGMSLSYTRNLLLAVGWTLYSVLLVWGGLRRDSKALYYCGYLALLPGLVMLGISGVAASPFNAYTPVLNARAAAFAIVIAGLYLIERAIRRRETGFRPVAALQVIQTVLAFQLVTVEITDKFRLFPNTTLPIALTQAEYLALAAGWGVFAALVCWIAGRKRAAAMFACALLVGLLGVATLAVAVLGYTPTTVHQLLVSPRSFAFAAVLISCLSIEWVMKRQQAQFPWIGMLPTVLQVIYVALAFEFITIEIIDTFRLLPPAALPIALIQAKYLALAASWGVFAAVVCWIAGYKRSAAMFVFALLAGMLAVGAMAIAGIGYAPATEYRLLVNPRSLAFAAVIVSCLAIEWALKRHRTQFPWIGALPTVVQVITALLIFQWVSVECWAYFAREIAFGPTRDMLAHLESFQQMSLSIAWVVYAILVIAYGFARRIVTLRLLGIVIFGLAILKIFIFDFSSLETLNRIFSFIGLGIMLLATSYLFQRYKHLILGSAPAAAPRETPEPPAAAQETPPDDEEKDPRRW